MVVFVDKFGFFCKKIVHLFLVTGLFKCFVSLVLVLVFVFGDLNYFAQKTAQATIFDTNTTAQIPQINSRQGLVTEAAFDTELNGSPVYAATLDSDEAIMQAVGLPVGTAAHRRGRDAEGNIENHTTQSRELSLIEPLYIIEERSSAEIIVNEGGFRADFNSPDDSYDFIRSLYMNYQIPGSDIPGEGGFVRATRFSENAANSLELTLEADWTDRARTDGQPYYVYEIFAPGGIESGPVQESALGISINNDLLLPRNILFFGGIQSQYIRSVRTYDDSGVLVEVLVNRGFTGNVPTEIEVPSGIRLRYITDYYTCEDFSVVPQMDSINIAETCPIHNNNWARATPDNENNFIAKKVRFGSDVFRHPEGTFRLLDKFGSKAKLSQFRVRSSVSMEKDSFGSVLEDWVVSYDNSSQSYFISSGLNNGLMLEMDSAGRVFVGDDNKSLSQRWHIQRDLTNPDLMIISNHQYANFKVVSDGNEMFGSSDSALVYGWDLEFVDVLLRDGVYFLESVTNENHVMQYDPVYREIGTWHWNKSRHQEFSLNYDPSRGAYRISHQDSNANDDYLAVKLGGNVEGDIHFVRKDDADGKQFWKVFVDRDGAKIISNFAYPNMVLTLDSGGVLAKQFVENNKNQRWHFKHYQLHTLQEGNYVFRSSLSKIHVVDYAVNSGEVGVWSRTGGGNQHWYVAYDYGKQAYTLASNDDLNMFLFWDTGNNSLGISNRDVGDYKFWRLDTTSDGKVVLRSYAQDRTKVVTLFVGTEGQVVNGVGFGVEDLLFPVWESQQYSSSQRFMFESIDRLPHLVEEQVYSVTLDSCVANHEPNCVREDNRFLSMKGDASGDPVQVQKDVSLHGFDHASRKIQFIYDETWKAYRLRFPDLGKYVTWYIPFFGEPFVGVYHEAEGKKEHLWDIIEDVNGGHVFINRYHPVSALVAPNSDSDVNVDVLYMGDSNPKQYTWNIRNINNINKLANSIHPVSSVAQKNGTQTEFGLHLGSSNIASDDQRLNHKNDNSEKQVVLGDFVSSENQLWHFVSTHLDGVEHIVSKHNDQYLTWEEELDDGSLVVADRNVAAVNQQWVKTLIPEENNIFVISNVDHPALCLTREDINISHGDSLRMQACDSNKIEQKWFTDLFDPGSAAPEPELPIDIKPLDVSSLRAADNVQDSAVNVGGGVGLLLDAESGRLLVETVDLETGLPPGAEVDDMFANSGKHVATVYDYEDSGEHSFVCAYDSAGFDLSIPAGRQQFYETIGVLEDNQFLVFGFENRLSFISVGVSGEARAENVVHYVVQRRSDMFVAWLPQDLAHDQPVLKKAINQQLGSDVDSFVTEADLQKLTSLTVSGEVTSINILEYATNLTYLGVNNTSLTYLPENIGNLSKLKQLNLYRNNIMVLPQSFHKLESLEFLDLANNQLTDISVVAGLASLQHLDVENNNISELPYMFEKLEKLSFLQLNNNNVIRFSNLPRSLAQGEFSAWEQSYESDLNPSYEVSNEVRGMVRFPQDSVGNIVLPEKDDYVNGQCSVIDVGAFDQGVGFISCSINDPASPISYQFKQEVFGGSFFQGTVSYKLVYPDEVSYQKLGVTKVGDKVEMVLDKVIPNSFTVAGQIPAGFRLETRTGQVFLVGSSTKVGLQQFSLEANFGDFWYVYSFGLETVSRDTILLRVGQKPTYQEVYTGGVGYDGVFLYAGFGEHVGGDLPGGLKFGSVWNSLRCDPFITHSCWGSSTIGFIGVANQLGSFEVQVKHRGLRRAFGILSLSVYTDFSVKNYTIRVW